MSPLARYEREVADGALEPDPVQALAAREMERVYGELNRAPAPGRGWAGALASRLRGRALPVRGLYLWGGVGRGKSHLMNLLHDALPFDDKMRVHFHGFMDGIHERLNALGHRRDPLATVAEELAARTRVVCFDEFQVTDIADAMLLGRLLAGLFERGVCLVATSNVAPADLYSGGLQRARFLPAIALIERHARVFELASDTDYRLRALERMPIYLTPLDAAAARGLEACFAGLAPEHVHAGAEVVVKGRALHAVKVADGIAWFEFAALCETARSAADYTEIARRYHTVVLAGVPVMDDRDPDRAIRFVHLVDELYQHNVNLVVSAAAAPADLYVGWRYKARFDRASSRLQEMRSTRYLARNHLA